MSSQAIDVDKDVYDDRLKRPVDFVLAAFIFVATLPLQAVAALLIRLDSPGPVIYRATRVGRGGLPFTLYKFRTMLVDAASSGPMITGAADPRVTRMGAFLRRTRLDELPQLWNVLRGDMSMVGPRPEDPRLVGLYTAEQRRILLVRPGITGQAQLRFRREADKLGSADPETAYLRNVMPRKLAVDLAYIDSRSLVTDLGLLWGTIVMLLTSFASMDTRFLSQKLLHFRRPLIVVSHLALTVLANYLAFAIRFDGAIPADILQLMIAGLPWLIVCRLVAFQVFRLYEGLWRYTGIWDMRNLIVAVILSTGAFAVATTFVTPIAGYPRSIYAIDSLLAIVFLGGLRLVGRLYREASDDPDAKRILILGAGDSGAFIAREMKHRPEFSAMPVGFVDDDPRKKGLFIHGIRVFGSRADLTRIVRRTQPDEFLVALPNVEPKTLGTIVASLEPFNVPIKLLPALGELLGGMKPALAAIRPVAIADLLTRPAVQLQPEGLDEFLRGRRVLVTGAGGSIGSELCRQIAAHAPASLVMVDRYENGLYAVERALTDQCAPTTVVSVIADVTDAARIDAVFLEHLPEIVFHAAAHKHVPLMEAHPCEAIINNVAGTRNMLDVSRARGSRQFVLISTDKAVNPSSIMGASKRVAELIVGGAGNGSGLKATVVRFGNVLGSSGSVVPLFTQQIQAGGPVTVTHPEVRRFFMLIPEAVELVLHASSMPGAGGTFTLEMGEQVPIVELARNLIRLAGLRPGVDIQIVFTGLRPGEKMAEELLTEDEVAEPSGRDGILRVQSRALLPQFDLLAAEVDELCEAAGRGDAAGALGLLQSIVPNFKHADGTTPKPAAELQPA